MQADVNSTIRMRLLNRTSMPGNISPEIMAYSFQSFGHLEKARNIGTCVDAPVKARPSVLAHPAASTDAKIKESGLVIFKLPSELYLLSLRVGKNRFACVASWLMRFLTWRLKAPRFSFPLIPVSLFFSLSLSVSAFLLWFIFYLSATFAPFSEGKANRRRIRRLLSYL